MGGFIVAVAVILTILIWPLIPGTGAATRLRAGAGNVVVSGRVNRRWAAAAGFDPAGLAIVNVVADSRFLTLIEGKSGGRMILSVPWARVRSIQATGVPGHWYATTALQIDLDARPPMAFRISSPTGLSYALARPRQVEDIVNRLERLRRESLD